MVFDYDYSAAMPRIMGSPTLVMWGLADEFDVSIRTLYKDMKRLWKWDVIRFEGAPKTGRYVLTEKGREMIEDLVE